MHPYLRRFEQAVLEGQGVFRACLQLKTEGWEPDLAITHVGFGNGLYIRVFPKARKIGFFEWFYNSTNSDVDFLQPGPIERDKALRLRTWNAQTLMELADCDVGVVPTQFQRQQFPDHLSSKLEVVHEGVDLDTLSELPDKRPQRPSCLPEASTVRY